MADPCDLASGLLDGSTAPSSILSSLPSASDASSLPADSWINLLHHDNDDELRNAFLLHLISTPSVESFEILARLITIHSTAACAVKRWNGPVLFGREFVTQISQHVLSLGLPASGELMSALLSSNRPRNEQCEEIRELALALSKSHPVELIELLVESVLSAAAQLEGSSEEEVGMKIETSTLHKLQDFRDVVETVASYYIENIHSDEGERILAAFGRLHAIAAYALETQLETLLGDDDAALILSHFNKTEEEEEMEVEETAEELSPLYAGLAQGALKLTRGQLEVTLEEIAQKLSITDAERWDERLAAMIDLERILASGLEGESRSLFIERLRKMSIPDQFADNRSQLTHAACRVLICTSFEYRDFIENDSTLASTVQQFIENCLPALMKLCTSGVGLMAGQGVACLQSICTTSTGHPKLLNILCEDIIDKKVKNNNRKRAAVMGVTAALRVWDESCLKNVDLIAKAVQEANSNRDPGVREEGRKAYWAMVSCDKTKSKAEEMFGERTREYRFLAKCRVEVDAEWDEEGRMVYLLNTGVLSDATKGKDSIQRPSTAPSRNNSNKRPVGVGAKDRGSVKAGRFSTPAKAAGAGESTTEGPSSAKVSVQNQGAKRTTFAPSSNVKTSIRSDRKSMGNLNGVHAGSLMKGDNTPVRTADAPYATLPTPSSTRIQSTTIYSEKENTPNTPINQTAPKVGTPVVSLLARPSPLSIEKSRSRNALNQVVTMLSDTSNSSEQYLGVQVLALFAKDNSEHESWDKMFEVVLELLLGLAKNSQTDQERHFARSPSKSEFIYSIYEAQHLYLQGIRSLVQFVPNRFEEAHIKEVMACLLESTIGPFEIVLTCERALMNLVTCIDPGVCFDCLLPYILTADVDLDSEVNPPILLSALRTMKHLMALVPLPKLQPVISELLQLCQTTITHKSVDMRKATVFVLVEMYFALGQELNVEGFSDGQRRLIDVYVGKHPRSAVVE